MCAIRPQVYVFSVLLEVPLSTRFSIWCSDVVFRSIKCLHPYSSPVVVFFKMLRSLVLFPSQLWFMLGQRGLRQPIEVTLREAVIIGMIKEPRWAYDAIPVCRDSPAAGRGLQPQLMLLPRYLKDGRAAGTKSAGRDNCSCGFFYKQWVECERRFRKAKIPTCINGNKLNKCSADIT